MVTTLIALFLRIVSNPLANVFQKKICLENSSLLCNFYTYFILGIFCIPFAFKIDWISLPQEFWGIYEASLVGIFFKINMYARV